MSRSRAFFLAFAAAFAIVSLAPRVDALGARSFKSGPIQVTADGSAAWVVNPDHDSVSRLDPSTGTLAEFPLPQPAPPARAIRHQPKGLSVREDGTEVWVACHDSDRVIVLDASGVPLATIDLPWGSGPWSVALSRDQATAVVTCTRSGHVAVIDTATRTMTAMLETFRTPIGIAFLDDGVSAWITHFHVFDRLPRVSRLDLSGTPRITTQERIDGSGPQDSAALRDADPTHNIAEGGYLNFRGHLAQRPIAGGGGRVWIPTQYGNRNQTVVNPDSIVQAVIRQVDLSIRRVPNTINDKIILTAPQVHDPQTSAWIGQGWNAPISGPTDIAFSADGDTCYLVNEMSENVLVMPSNTPPSRPALAPPLPVVTVGLRPSGIAVSPVAIAGRTLAFVSNQLSRSISILDVTDPTAPAEMSQVPTTPVTPEPLDPTFLEGEHLFHSSNDPRISGNKKVACATCHIHGEHDGRSWELQFVPGSHGPRQTQSLLGLSLSYGGVDAGTGYGQLHRTGDRDEVQDFDHTFRGVQMGGTGFLSAAQIQPPLGAGPNAGLDAELDALADYVLRLEPLKHSPYRMAGGSLSAAAIRGATMFLATGSSPADGGCVTCHVPETGYVDLAFHDVGAYRPPVAPNAENELGVGARGWDVNTASLVGAWDSPPYAGGSMPKEPETLLAALVDSRDPARLAPHGRLAGLTGRQMRDIEAFVGSIDGDLQATEVRAAVDVAGPRVVRVAPTSLTRIEVWLDESVAPQAASTSAWRVDGPPGTPVSVDAATLDTKNADHVTLTVSGMRRDCADATFTVVPLGPIPDRADSVTGGSANLLDASDPSNRLAFTLGDTLSITLGASGYENLTIPVHDVGTLVNLADRANNTVWLRAVQNGAAPNTDFVRFEWSAAFTAATGITDPLDITDASFSLQPLWGDTLPIEARLVLQRWWDYGGNDMGIAGVGTGLTNPGNGHNAPTWRDSEYAVKAWNQNNAAARLAGVNGFAVSDYFGLADTGFDPVVIAQPRSIQARQSIAGAGVTDAFRFWLANPSVDYGFALNIPVGSRQEQRFQGSEEELNQFGPVLTITYRLPAPTTNAPPEVSPAGVPDQLLVTKDPAGLRLSFEDLGALASAYDLYEGAIGSYYSHSSFTCGMTPPIVSGHRETTIAPTAGSRYYLVTGADSCSEGRSGEDSFGAGHPGALLDCVP